MKKGTLIVLLVGILLLAFGLTMLQIAHHRGESFLSAVSDPIRLGGAARVSYDQKDYTVLVGGEQRFASGEVKALDLNWISGSVSVERYDGSELVVREKAAVKLTEDESLRWKLSGGTLSILPCANNVPKLPDKELTVLVPRSLTLTALDSDAASASTLVRGIDAAGRISLDAASGSLTAEDCRCAELSLNSASGSQKLVGVSVSGKVKANLASGSFTADTLSCAELDVDGASGSQRIDALVCDRLTLSSASGSLRGEGLDCRSVKTESASGSVRLGFAAAPDKVKVDAVSGSVTLSFPRGTGIDLDFDSASGSIHGEVVYGDLPVDVNTASGSLTIEYK